MKIQHGEEVRVDSRTVVTFGYADFYGQPRPAFRLTQVIDPKDRPITTEAYYNITPGSPRFRDNRGKEIDQSLHVQLEKAWLRLHGSTN